MDPGYCEFCGIGLDSECIVCDRGRTRRYTFRIPARELIVEADTISQARRKLVARYRVDVADVEPFIEMNATH